MRNLLEKLKIDYLLVNSTNEYLVEYSSLSENSRYTLTGFSGSTGDALVTKDSIYLFVDGRYHIQADQEVKSGVKVVKLQLGQNQDEEILKLVEPNKVLGIVSKKVSQARLEKFNGFKIKLLSDDPINNFTESHTDVHEKVAYRPKIFETETPVFISNLEEVSYLTGYRDFTQEYSSKIWAKLVVKDGDLILFTDNERCAEYLQHFNGEILVDKNTINAYDYSLIKNPVHKISPIKSLKSVKTDSEIELYKSAFKHTDDVMYSIRNFIMTKENLSEFEIEQQLREEFKKSGAKNLSFKPIVAINKNSALAHYSKASTEVKLQNGDLVLIDCGAYYDGGLATDITRVFVKGDPSELQKEAYTLVLKAFLNSYKSRLNTGAEMDKLAHSILDNKLTGFGFEHGLGHGIGINVHEAPPMINRYGKELEDNMCFTIEPGLYCKDYFGIRLENSCYRFNGENISFTKMGYESKLINYNLLSEQEQVWLKEFEVL